MIDRRLQTAIDFELRQLDQETEETAHFHFAESTFDYLVPDFDDTGWIDLAYEVIDYIEIDARTILLSIPLFETAKEPIAFDIRELSELEPWEPPTLYLLPTGWSAFDERENATWFSDEVEQKPDSKAWVSAHFDDEQDPPLWRLSLRIEKTI